MQKKSAGKNILRFLLVNWITRTVFPALLIFIILITAFWLYAIPVMRENLIESKKEMIIELTNSGHYLLQHYYERVMDGELSEDESKSRFKERLTSIRYGPGGSYYYWIIDFQPQLIVHPYNIDLVDRDISEYENPDFREVIREMVFIIREHGRGFIEYDWEWMGDPDRVEPKLSYVKHFEPWDWIIGTGVYMNDVEKRISIITKEANRIFLLFGLTGLIITVIISINGIRTERRLFEAKERAEESDRLKSTFLANMCHEIRTPMNGILGFANLLRNKELSAEKQNRYLEIIDKSGLRMLNLINDLIDISKIESNQVKVEYETVEIISLMDYLYGFFKPEANKKGLELKMTIPSEKQNIYISTDKDKLLAIMVNLLKNALKYTDTGRVEFGFLPKPGLIEFFVEDSGRGIAKDDQNVVFDRFVRVNEENSNVPDGAGLGLAISKAYVKLMKGRIWLESEIGKGTRFSFILPADRAGST